MLVRMFKRIINVVSVVGLFLSLGLAHEKAHAAGASTRKSALVRKISVKPTNVRAARSIAKTSRIQPQRKAIVSRGARAANSSRVVSRRAVGVKRPAVRPVRSRNIRGNIRASRKPVMRVSARNAATRIVNRPNSAPLPVRASTPPKRGESSTVVARRGSAPVVSTQQVKANDVMVSFKDEGGSLVLNFTFPANYADRSLAGKTKIIPLPKQKLPEFMKASLNVKPGITKTAISSSEPESQGGLIPPPLSIPDAPDFSAPDAPDMSAAPPLPAKTPRSSARVKSGRMGSPRAGSNASVGQSSQSSAAVSIGMLSEIQNLFAKGKSKGTTGNAAGNKQAKSGEEQAFDPKALLASVRKQKQIAAVGRGVGSGTNAPVVDTRPQWLKNLSKQIVSSDPAISVGGALPGGAGGQLAAALKPTGQPKVNSLTKVQQKQVAEHLSQSGLRDMIESGRSDKGIKPSEFLKNLKKPAKASTAATGGNGGSAQAPVDNTPAWLKQLSQKIQTKPASGLKAADPSDQSKAGTQKLPLKKPSDKDPQGQP